MAEIEVGQKAPAFALTLGNGENWRSADHAGKALVVYFYPKDDTSGCTAQAIDFSRLRPDFEAAGAELIGISPDSVKSHAKFAEKHGLDLSLGADEERQAIEAFGVWSEKSMYGKKYMGVDRSTFLIAGNGEIARVWRKVKVPGHAEEVLAALKAL